MKTPFLHHAKNPLISVIMPTFNREHLILRALASLERQSFKNFELIICDDGSTDSTDEIVMTYAQTISSYPVKYIQFSHRGVAEARNIGLSLANGHYIALLDSDDTYHPYKLEAQADEMEKNQDSAFCYTGYRLVNTGLCIDPGTFDYNRFISGNYLCCASVLMRRAAVIEVGGYDHRLHLAEDWDLLIRLSEKGSILSIPDPMYEYYSHSEQTTTRESMQLDYFTSLVRRQYGGQEIETNTYMNFTETAFVSE